MNQQNLLKILKRAEGTWGVVIKHVGKDVVFEYNADAEFPAASVGKVPIALYIFHLAEIGGIDLTQMIEVKKENHLPGTGILQFMTPGLKLPLSDLLKLMLITSDNTAAKLLAHIVGPEKINAYLKSVGFEKTQLGIHDEQFDFGVTTPHEIALLLEGICTSAFLNKENSDALLGIMKKCENQLSIRRYLPHDTSLGKKLEVANKGGALDDVRHDVGIVFAQEPYVIAVLSKEIKDHSYKPDNAGVLTIAQLSKEAYTQLEP